MRTDSLFYRIFSTAPKIFFELIDYPPTPGYQLTNLSERLVEFASIADLINWLQAQAVDLVD